MTTMQLPAPAGPVVYGGYAGISKIKALGVGCAADFLGHASVNDFTGTMGDLLPRYQAAGLPLVLGVPLLVNGEGASSTSTAVWASRYMALARAMVAHGFGNAALRIGWEPNTTGQYPWCPPNLGAADYVKAFRTLVASMRPEPGADFRFVWNANVGTPDPRPWYPGDGYVDQIGVDVYDWRWASAGTAASRWSTITGQSFGLNWIRDYAKLHGKPLVLGEYGLRAVGNHGGMFGGGDDPAFLASVWSFCRANQVAWWAYFDAAASDLTAYPQSRAAFITGKGGAA